MRKLVLILLLLPGLLLAQKAIKPNINKALSSWKQGKLAEAKEMIDVCITAEKTMSNGNTWYYRGLIYTSLDTTSNPEFESLKDNAFETAMEAFKKADELSEKDKEYFIRDDSGFPVTRLQQVNGFAGHYINIGAAAYQEDDYENALVNFEKYQKLLPNDTTGYFYAGIVANQMDADEKAVSNLKKYYEKGGNTVDGYYAIINIYNKKEDKTDALAITREAKAKFPNNVELPKYEIQFLIQMDKVEEARTNLRTAIQTDPSNKVLHYFLGYTNMKMDNVEEAKKNFEASLKIDDKFFDAQLSLAKIYYAEAEKIKKQMASLGISDADRKKKFELDKVYVEKLKVALPYFEKAEQLNPSDSEVLDGLYIIYGDLDNTAQVKRIEKRMKELGLDN